MMYSLKIKSFHKGHVYRHVSCIPVFIYLLFILPVRFIYFHIFPFTHRQSQEQIGFFSCILFLRNWPNSNKNPVYIFWYEFSMLLECDVKENIFPIIRTRVIKQDQKLLIITKKVACFGSAQNTTYPSICCMNFRPPTLSS